MIAQSVAVAELMTPRVLFAKPEQDFQEIARLFGELHIHHLPVTDENGKLVGIISANDIMKAYSRWRAADDQLSRLSLKVADLMTSSPYYVCPSSSIQKAAELFTLHGIQSLPVVEGNKVVGIITSRDLVRYFAEL